MPITMLDAVEFSGIASKNFVIPVVSVDPAGYEAGLIYNSTSKEIKYHNGTIWVALGPAGAGGPPTGAAGGDLSGSYPNPQILAGAIVDADVNASAAIQQSKISGLTTSLTAKADSTITLTAGNGLTGGGTLAANRTIDFAGDSTFTIAADTVSVASAPKWTTGRTITLTGDTTGVSAAWDGSTAISFVTAIAAGVIVDADVSGSAAIATSKISGLDSSLSARALTTVDLTAGNGLTGGGTLAASRTFSVGAGTGITVNADDVALNLTYTDARYLQLSGGTLTNFLTLHADPTSASHAATKQYVDLTSQGFSFKQAVRVASSTNVASISGLLTIDGVTVVAGNRVLLAGQTTQSQNGVYVAAAGAWARSADADASGELVAGTLVPVAEGTTWGNSQAMCTGVGTAPWVPGTNISTWTRYGSASDIVGGAGLVRNGNSLDIVSTTADLTVNTDSLTLNSAPKWTTARSITLTGDVTGTVASVDGTANVSIATTVVGGGSMAKKYAVDVPAGTAGIVITHNLNSLDVTAGVYLKSTGATVYCDIIRTGVNTITLTFAAAVSAGAYRVVVTG